MLSAKYHSILAAATPSAVIAQQFKAPCARQGLNSLGGPTCRAVGPERLNYPYRLLFASMPSCHPRYSCVRARSLHLIVGVVPLAKCSRVGASSPWAIRTMKYIGTVAASQHLLNCRSLARHDIHLNCAGPSRPAPAEGTWFTLAIGLHPQ